MPKPIELKLKIGDPAPPFTALTHDGKSVSLASFKGRSVVLFFYPKDNTSGCTKEACSFRDHYSEFEKQGVAVLGVSVDSAVSHEKFIRKFNLPFPLLVDEDHRIVTAYGVWGDKTFMGRKYQGTHRVTFLVGPDGRIKNLWPAVKPDTHTAEVLAAL
jgi:thioredoxin-dependent peroxiredoxin